MPRAYLDIVTNTLFALLLLALFTCVVAQPQGVRGPGRRAMLSAYKKVVAGRRTGLTMLVSSRVSYTKSGMSISPHSYHRVLWLDFAPQGPNSSLFPYYLLCPDYHPLLVGPESHFCPPNEEVSEVLSVQEP